MSLNRAACGGKGKKLKKDLNSSHLITTSDDIWMKAWGHYDNVFDAAKEAEMSVSDPEEYLVSRSDEDVMFPSHSVRDPSVTLNSEHGMLRRDDDDYVSRLRHDDYVTSIEFNECTERGLFCREENSIPVVHYHCPCCVKHSETSILLIEQHYKPCMATMSAQNALFTSICKHDDYITFYECYTSDPDCPARDLKLPIHYHCPCCLIYTKQNIGQVIRHQLLCCKSLTTLTAIQPPAESHHVDETDVCTHAQGVVRYRICFEKSTEYCNFEVGRRPAKNLHFHCMCCNEFSENKLRSLRKHQRSCCHDLSDVNKVMFLFEINAALQQYYLLTSIQNRKRATPRTDPMSILAPPKKILRKASAVVDDIDDNLFTKCLEVPPICTISERNRTTHYHCPVCKIFTARRLQRIKFHYYKCMRPGRRTKPRGTPLNLQCELVDKLNRVFLVRAASSGPGVPTHVIYRAGPSSSYMFCEDGCKMDRKLGKVKCRHLESCEQYVCNSGELAESGPEIPIFSDISLFYNFDEDTKNTICVLYQQCTELRIPIIRPYYPIIASSKPVFTYYSVSICTTPKYFSRTGRVLVTFNERSQSFKCKCNEVLECVHIVISQMYHSHFTNSADDKLDDSKDEAPPCDSDYYIQSC